MNNTSILIPSCDKYSDLWPIFFRFFWNYWPDCPFPIYLGSNYKIWSDERVNSITIGPDLTWTENLTRFIDSIDTNKVIIFLDDFLVSEQVDSKKVIKMVGIAEEFGLGCLRLKPSPPPSKHVQGLSNLGVVLPGEPYRISTQVAIWDKDFLKLIARTNLNIWEFEHFGSLLSDKLIGKVWCVCEPIIQYYHCIERGKWLPRSFEHIQKFGIEPDYSIRGVKNEFSERKGAIHFLVSFVYKFVPRGILRSYRRFRPRHKIRELLENEKSIYK